MPLIHLSGIEKFFGPLRAVAGIDVTAADGEMLTLLGPSGCGKTTTLRMVAGLEDPDSGTIQIGERTIFDSARRINVPAENRGLGMVFQSYAIWPHMTVAENVAYPLRMRRIARGEIKELVAKVLTLVGMAGFEDKPATKLSGGQQQRVALARALVFQPEILLLDEPLSNLDAKLRENMRFELRIMQRRVGLTALYVTHDQEEALTLSDRIIVMNKGAIEQIGTPEEIYEKPATRFVAEFIGKANMIELADPVDYGSQEAIVRLRTRTGMTNIVLPKAALRSSAGGGDPPCLFIRPEKITLVAPGSPAEADRCVLPGQVLERAYVGDHLEYLVALNERASLRVSAPPGRHWPTGADVGLGIMTRDMVLYG